MAAKPEGFFTNTNLMIAGVICAIIGAGLAFVYINRQVADATGKPVKIAFAKKNIAPNELCRDESIRWVDLPDRFVEEAGGKFVREDTITVVRNHNPSRLIEADEPLLTTEFPTGGPGDMRAPTPPFGMETITIDVDQKSHFGQLLNIGSIIALTGNYDFSPDGKSDPHTLLILDKIYVVSINGFLQPTVADRRNVRSVGIFVGEANAKLLTKLKLFQKGDFDVQILGPATIRADARDQVPSDTLTLLKDKLKLPPDFFR